jgi:hypothetical protein
MRPIACFLVPLSISLATAAPATAAPQWIGSTIERKGTAFATCTGPAVALTMAYEGEPDGSSPAVGDVYSIRFTFENKGNCVGNLGETAYGFDVGFELPRRHEPEHNFQYGGRMLAIQCFLRDAAGAQSQLSADVCAQKLTRPFGSRWVIETAGGYERFRWKVPKGGSLDVVVPVVAVDPVARDEAGLKAHVTLQMSTLAGFDFTDLAVPMAVAATPMKIEQPLLANLGPTSVTLSARMFNRFVGGEAYIQLEPAPMFDSVRLFPAADNTNYEDHQTSWLDLQPDTEYRWRPGILTKPMNVVGEYQTFRTPPASQAKVVADSDGDGILAARAAVDRLREARLLRSSGAGCNVGGVGVPGGPARAGGGWLLLVLLSGLIALRPKGVAFRRSWAGAFLAVAGALVLAACPGNDGDGANAITGGGDPGNRGDPGGGPPSGPPAGGGGGGGATTTGGALPIAFLRAQPGLFAVPAGWEVNQASLKAWQKDNQHVVTLSPPGNPSVVLGLREFITKASPSRVIDIAALSAEVVTVLEKKSGAQDGPYARWVAQVTLQDKPAVMGMFAWGNVGNKEGERVMSLAALVTPTLAEFQQLGGIVLLRKLAYALGPYEEGAPELMLSGTYSGAESDGGYFDPVTGSSSSSGHAITVTLTGSKISVTHLIQVALSVGVTSTSTEFTSAEGTYIRAGGIILPSWSRCTTQINLNGTTGSKDTCEAGWGATIEFLPRGDGSFIVRMPGLESPTIDEPGTVVVTPKP